jgi:hypothetical protein
MQELFWKIVAISSKMRNPSVSLKLGAYLSLLAGNIWAQYLQYITLSLEIPSAVICCFKSIILL